MLQPRPHIRRLMPVVHGGINYPELEQLGFSPGEILDFSVSTNPFGPPPGLAEAMFQASIERYPDSESTELKACLSGQLGLAPENILAGSGTTEIIRLAALAYFGPGDQILIPQPVYGDYELACNLTGAAVSKIWSSSDVSFNWDVEKLVGVLKSQPHKGVFLCNPVNPTGQYLSRVDVDKILLAAPETLVVLDEAYIAFTHESWSSLELIEHPNLLILRSMTKDYALAGLRLGYALAHKSIIQSLNNVKSPWNVSSVAQQAGIYALNCQGYLDYCRLRIKEARDFLVQGLREAGLEPLPSRTHFFLVAVKNSKELRQSLLKRGILVRDCTSFGLSGYLRLSTRSIEDCGKLLGELQQEPGLKRNDG